MKPYNTTESKKEQVRSMFDAIAVRYDALNHLLSMGVDRSWRRKVVRRVHAAKPATILDLATGTGDLAIMLARECEQSAVTGIDLSEQMLAIGRQKVSQAGLEQRITLMQGDAENLPAEDNSFDAVTVAFGVRNFEDLARGVAEIHRVLRPGGIVCVLEFGMPRNKIFGTLYRFYFHRVLPAVGRMISHDKSAYTYLPQSVDEFPYGEKFRGMLLQAGFTDCRITNLWGGIAQIYYGRKQA